MYLACASWSSMTRSLPGAAIFSAVWALEAAGASAVPLVIARFIKPDWAPSADMLKWLTAVPWADDRCGHCGPARPVSKLFQRARSSASSAQRSRKATWCPSATCSRSRSGRISPARSGRRSCRAVHPIRLQPTSASREHLNYRDRHWSEAGLSTARRSRTEPHASEWGGSTPGHSDLRPTGDLRRQPEPASSFDAGRPGTSSSDGECG
jgi:hypothetical protein